MEIEIIVSKLANKSIEDNNFELLQNFCDVLTFGVYIRDLDNLNFIFVNEKLARILGYQKDELIGTNLFWQNTSSVSFNDNLLFKLKNSTAKIQKVKTKSKNGELLTLLHSFNILEDNNGKHYSIGMLIAANSIEENRTLSYFTHNFDLEDFFAFIKLPSAFINKKVKQIIFVNDDFCNYLQVTNEENKLEKVNSLCFKNDFFRNNYEIFYSENLTFYEFYADILDDKNNAKPTLCILNQIPDLDFDLLIMHPIVSDKFDVQNLTTSPKTIENGENLIKSNFLTLVSHEFRTPLTKILLATDLLMNYDDKMNREEKIARLNDIKDTIYGMTKLMEAVMTISRMEQNLFKAEYEFIDLRVFFEMILDGFLVRNN